MLNIADKNSDFKFSEKWKLKKILNYFDKNHKSTDYQDAEIEYMHLI